MDQPPVDGATPLDPDEAEALIPGHIGTRPELNQWEQANIAKAVAWLAERRSRGSVLTIGFLRELHKRMFDDTWRWAGQYRKTDKTIGVPASRIPESLVNLLEDAEYWIEHGTLSHDEIGARLHHRLVWIHPFANGNGRHARLMTDALLEELGAAPFTWGSASRVADETMRSVYIAALRHADAGDYGPLFAFVRK